MDFETAQKIDAICENAYKRHSENSTYVNEAFAASYKLGVLKAIIEEIAYEFPGVKEHLKKVANRG